MFRQCEKYAVLLHRLISVADAMTDLMDECRGRT